MHQRNFSLAHSLFGCAIFALFSVACGGDDGSQPAVSAGPNASGGAGLGAGGASDTGSGGTGTDSSSGGATGSGGANASGGSSGSAGPDDLPKHCTPGGASAELCVENITAKAGDTVTLEVFGLLPSSCQSLDTGEGGATVLLPALGSWTASDEVESNDASICGRRDLLADGSLPNDTDGLDEIDMWYSPGYFSGAGGCTAQFVPSTGRFMSVTLQVPAGATPGDYELKLDRGYVADQSYAGSCIADTTGSGVHTSGTLRILP